ncbi:hypothetical protein Tco_1047587 [Tanacetum coccineum]
MGVWFSRLGCVWFGQHPKGAFGSVRSTKRIPPKKSRGKCSQGKKNVDDSQETIDVSEESKPVLEPVKKKTASRIVVKKKVTIFADDNIILDLNIALELGKSISLDEAEEEEATKQVHDTHARIVTESVPESTKKKTGSRSSRSVVIQDTPSATKSKPAALKPKIKGVQSLTPEEQKTADVMQALKESKKISSRQPGTRGSSEGTGRISGFLDESTIVSATSNEGTGTKLGVPDAEKVSTKEKVILEWGSEQESEYSEEDLNEEEDVDWIDSEEDDEKKDDTDDDKSIDHEMTDDEETNDEVLQGKEQVNDDEDKEMLNAKVEDSGEGDVKVSDAAKADAEKTEEAKDDSKKAELPPITALVTTLPPPSISTILPVHLQQITTPIPLLPITTDAPIITSVVHESDALSAVQLRVTKLEKDVFELKKIDHSAKSLATLKSQVSTLPSQARSRLQQLTLDKNLKSASEILKIKKEQAEKQKMPKYTIKSTDKASLKEYDQKSALYQTMHENKSFNKNPANHRLYHALMEALIEDQNAMDKGVADTVKDHKRKHDDDDDDDEDSPAGPNQGKKTKRRRTKESEYSKKPSSTKETSKEPIAEVVMDDAGENVVRNDDQPQDTSKPKAATTPNPEWFKQPPRPPTPDLEWNKRQVILGQPEEHWFNQTVSAIKDPLTFNDLMATPIDFSKYVLNRLKINNLTQDLLLGPAYDLLKGTCRPDHLTVAADYFFNNDMEYLKSSDPERTYTTSITKTKAARYEIVGIEDMVPTLWSTIKHAYDKDAAKGIKH